MLSFSGMISAHWLSVNQCQRFPFFCFYSFSHSPRRNRKFVRLSLPAKTLEGQLHNALSSFKGIPVSSSVVPLNLPLFPGGNLPSWVPPLAPYTHIPPVWFCRVLYCETPSRQHRPTSRASISWLSNWCVSFSRACYGLKPHSSLRQDLSSIVHNSTPWLFCR